ncbi:MAG: tetratricopeptide repeat protein [Deltaproteobacteria bacterium]|nr:tetratricopeptide repeat protein [Deltaproteobacteria bacterium]
MRRSAPLWLVVVITIFAFFGGAMGGILFCGHYAHEAIAPVSGVSLEQPDEGQIKVLEAEVKKNPGDATSWTHLGNLYFDTDQYEKAIAAYRQSVQLDPRNADVWTDLGIMYRRSGQPDKAIGAFDRAIVENPNHENARFNKGIVLMHDMDDWQGAIRAWEALLEVNPLATAGDDRLLFEIVEHYKTDPQSRPK